MSVKTKLSAKKKGRTMVTLDAQTWKDLKIRAIELDMSITDLIHVAFTDCLLKHKTPKKRIKQSIAKVFEVCK